MLEDRWSVVRMSFSIPMNLVLLLSTSILCIGVFSEEASKPDVVNVGAIFTFGTINGKVAKVAMKAAENDINSDPSVLGGRKLTISLHDSNYSSFLGIIGGIPSLSLFNLLLFLTFDYIYLQLVSFISCH